MKGNMEFYTMVYLWSSWNYFTGRLDCSKDMSAHVSTCTSYDFNTFSTSCV